MDKPRVKIINWSIRWSNYRNGMELEGDAFNHPLLGSAHVYTSKIININIEKMEVETLNTIYELG